MNSKRAIRAELGSRIGSCPDVDHRVHPAPSQSYQVPETRPERVVDGLGLQNAGSALAIRWAAAVGQCPAPGRAARGDELHAGDTAASAAMLCKLRSAARPVETQAMSVGSSGADRLSTAPTTAGDALILASSARSRTARCDSVSSPVRSTSPTTETILGPTISKRR